MRAWEEGNSHADIYATGHWALDHWPLVKAAVKPVQTSIRLIKFQHPFRYFDGRT